MKGSFLKSHRSFAIALFAGFLTAGVLAVAGSHYAWIAGVDMFFAAFLVTGMIDVIRRNKDWDSQDDEPAVIVFLVAAGFAATGLFLLFRAVNSEGVEPAMTALAILTLPLGWATVHLMAAFHYARLYHLERREHPKKLPLQFADMKDAPDAWDFLYFAFVIGMTAQTSDTTINSKRLRRFALLHGVLSFTLNTVVVAAAVNIVVSLRG